MPSWNIVKWFLLQYWCKWPWFPRCSVFPVRCQAFPVIPSCCLQEQTWFQSGEEQGGSDVMISALIWVCIFTCCVKVLEGFTEPHNILLCFPVISLHFHQFHYMALVSCNATPANISALKSQIPIFRKNKRRAGWQFLSDVSSVFK